ncbi:flagellin lysine-N-methylase [Thiohalophilus thiocyanatoxydans]|nr:flagellin lysine-N-methylase [Thiohalophilus thiocyanatoxydans]
MKFVVLEKFECAAGDCPDDCCHGWRIDVDPSTLAGWRDLPQTALTRKMQAALQEEAGESYLQRRDDGCCTFLADGLCEIQKQFGHETLPRTCREYPRVSVGRASSPVASAYLSCPEVVRLLLELPPDTALFTSTDSTAEQATPSRFDPHYAEKLLDRFIATLLDDSQVMPGEVLYQIAITLSGLLSRDTFDQTLGQLEKLQDDAVETQKLVAKTRKAFRNRQLNVNREQAGHFWHAVMTLCRVCREPDWLEAVSRSGLELTGGEANAPRKVYANVTELWRRSNTLAPSLQAGIKRYLQVKLVNHGFPMAVHRNQLVSTFLECAIATMQIIYLSRLHGLDKDPTRSDLSQIIYKVERAMVHNDVIEEVLNRQPELLHSLGSYAPVFLGDH